MQMDSVFVSLSLPLSSSLLLSLLGDVAELMCHRKSTADNIYVVRKREQSVISAAKGLSELMRTQLETPEKIAKSECCEEDGRREMDVKARGPNKASTGKITFSHSCQSMSFVAK